MSDRKASIEKLEKQLRVLKKKLERSEWHRVDLENQHDRDQHLYRRLHADLEAARREAEIEAALERVRTRAMAMKKPEELSGISETVFTELKALGFTELRNTEIIINHDTEASITSYYYSDYGVTGVIDVDYTTNPTLAAWAQEMQKADDAFVEIVIAEDEIANWQAYRLSLGYVPDPKLDDATTVYYYSYSIGLGALSISSFQPVDEEHLKVLEQFRNVFNLAYQRYVDIARAKAQAREAQIEAALERVRARAMAMHASEELLEVIFKIHQEYAGLGLPCGAFWHTRYTPESYHKALTGIDGQKLAAVMELPRDFSSNPALAAWECGDENIGVFKFDTEGACQYLHHMVTKGKFHEIDPQAITEEMVRENDGWTFVQARTSHGEIGYSLWGETEPSQEAKEVLVRFAKTFDLAYQRFEDLQQAEARAREAKIEAALERVRSRAMAMHSSDDISDATAIVFTELEKLGISTLRCGINIIHDSGHMDLWTATATAESKDLRVLGRLDKTMHPMLEGLFEAWKAQQPFFTHELAGEDLQSYYQALRDAPEYDLPQDARPVARHFAYLFIFPEGGLFNFAQQPLAEASMQILKRFTAVFAQTYRRYLDLKRAEGQAREAQVQLALERTRTRSMLMQQSDELVEISKVFHEQLLLLGVDSEFSYVWLPDEEHDKHMFWATWAEERDGSTVYQSKSVTYDLDRTEPYTAACFAAWESDEPIHIDFIPPDEVDHFFATWEELLRGADNLKSAFFPDGIYYAEAYMKYGCFGINIRRRLATDEQEILRRFAVEFERAYTRFLDLKKAEEQARQAVRQASLDRVRAEIASMRTAADLQHITPLIWRELTTLGVPFFRCGMFIIDEAEEAMHVYLTTPEGKALAALPLGFNDAPIVTETVAHWRQERVYVEEWEASDMQAWTAFLQERGLIQQPTRYLDAEAPPEHLALHFVPFEQGMLYVGSTAPLAEEEVELVQALADAFAIAYARYEDFQRLEAKNREVEAAMDELKATQQQLVQSEKMASLGQLTAGIAHEIKNPLNFVNNFADLNQELAEELHDELAKLQDHLPEGIADDFKETLSYMQVNAAKIREQGQRADGIVRSMMQHASGGTGEREACDVNALVEEYVGLAYHGKRAQVTDFNVDLQQDLSDEVGSVAMVPQEIGRVLLNLLGNAFDAVHEHAARVNGQYEPTVTISTRRTGALVEIRVCDNGPGIPQGLRAKIFEPFFTTKPTGSGTGLGLSLSYDIVTQGHGGTLTVESEEGEGATFVVTLPVDPKAPKGEHRP